MNGYNLQGRELRIQFAQRRRPENPREHYRGDDRRGGHDDRRGGYSDRRDDRRDDRRGGYDDRRRVGAA